MSEISYWWTTDGTGDGPSGGYTQVHLSDVVRTLAGASYHEGVIPSLLNECAGTVGGANTFNINTGSGVVDGKLYENDSSVGVNIPSTSSDTRIDRVVLRADWTAQTIRITRIAGTQSSTPSAPTITQTPGSTYDIMLYQVNVNTSGTVTIESDEREWATAPVDDSTIENNDGTLRVKASGITANEIATDAVTAGKIDTNAVGNDALASNAVQNINIGTGVVDTDELAADAVTTAKIAAGAVDTTELAADSVDDTKAGDRVPQFYRRQGGSATIWSTGGSTTYTPTAVRMQAGVIHQASTGAAAGSTAVSFPTAFSYAPIVFAIPQETEPDWHVVIDSISTSGFTIYWESFHGDLMGGMDFNWLAIGPE